ncbi:uncharacterized protein LOC130509334 [Raphanus sativus]|uniref:Uncharacterized protein LOC130509334 n=1 Tax=Raphanus sativus TaxID=3726 RepID=A0A9W3DBR8_RAPSA|nr:uncharacterized protein LOC130509334 [Raphanus sativus]
MLKKEVVESLLGPLGKVEKVELHAKNSTSLEYIRASVTINTEEPLQFRSIERLKSGMTYPTELEYEKLIKVCYGCKRLTHDQTRCPFQILEREEAKRLTKDRSKKTCLKEKLLEKEIRAKESLKRSTSKGVEIRNPPTATNLRGGKKKATGNLKEDTGKGKRIVATPRVIWRQKADVCGSGKTKSTEESTAHPRGSGDHSGVKSVSGGRGGVGKSLDSNETDSVFNRLGRPDEEWGSKGSRGRRTAREPAEDLRWRISGMSSGEKNDGKSSKGSRSPPSVFNRLGGHTHIAEGSQTSKRRRQEGSDERNAKKARTGSSEKKKKESPSVFMRLGGVVRGPETDNTGEAHHSALVAVSTPIHSARMAANSPALSVRRIALGSGSSVKEGLMGNTNPSRSI